MATPEAFKPDTHDLSPVVEMPADLWRDWMRLLFEAVASSVAIAVLLALSVLMGAAVARADVVPQTQDAALAGSGAAAELAGGQEILRRAPSGTALLMRAPQGYVTAPLQRSAVRLQVTGNIVRARVSQTYRNPNDAWLNGRYQFPLPGDAAVDSLQMRVGNRLITGVIKPREEARKAFTQARDNGQRASLIEQHRANVFTADVANLAPLGEVTIDIEYQQVLALTDGRWALRFPTVVTPRYTPGARPDGRHDESIATRVPGSMVRTVATESEPEHAPGNLAQANTPGQAPLPAQPMTNTDGEHANRFSLEVDLDAGLPVSLPVSHTHGIVVNTITGDPATGGESYRVLLDGDVLADKDFELSWGPKPQAEPRAALQVEQKGQDWYALLTVSPPTVQAETVISNPREVILVLDTSGSMQGTLDDAKAAVTQALQALRPGDRFNIIEFNSSHSSLFGESRPATTSNLQMARRFLRALRANGGTEMRGALMEALKSSVPVDTLSQLVFVTDGAVGNEHELFNLIETMLGDRKVFTVGIGAAPNDYFMRKAAAAGRGTYTFIADTRDVAARMRELFNKLQSPMLTRLQLRDDRGELVDTGNIIRDLYAGEPVLQTFRLPSRPEGLVIEAEQNDMGWQEPLHIQTVSDRGIDRLWARDQIDTLSEEIRRYAYDGKDPARLREDATRLAMTHHLVSAYTSLVAVETVRVRPAEENATDTLVPGQLPRGWKTPAASLQSASISSAAPLAQTSNDLLWQILTGGLLLLAAALCFAVILFRAQALLDQHPN